MSGVGVVICPDGRVIPAGRALYLHNQPTAVPVDQKALVTALAARPPADTFLVHLPPDAERSAMVVNYLAGLPRVMFDRLAIKPAGGVLDPIDLPALEDLSDLHKAALDLPVREELQQSERAVPIDAQGRQTTWQQASSVRLLTRAQLAARTALHEATRFTPDQRLSSLEQWGQQLAGIRDRHRVTPGGPRSAAVEAVEAVAAYVARYGVPAGLDLDDLLLPALPPPPARLMAMIGLTAGTADPDQLIRGLLASPGSAALVSYRPVPAGPETLGWLVPADSGLFWLYGGGELIPVEPDGPYAAILRDADTRVAPVDPAGRPTTAAGEDTGRPARIAAIVGQALSVNRQVPPATRLRAFVTSVEAAPTDLDRALADCLPRAYAAFVAYHGRAGNRSDVEVAADPARLRVADLEHLLSGSFEPLGDVAQLRGWLLDAPGAMALLRLPTYRDRPGHLFWLWSEPGPQGPTLRWVDSQEQGLLDAVAFAADDDVRANAVQQPGVTVFRLDPAGLPVRSAELGSPSRTVPALTLARDTSAEPGMRAALRKILPATTTVFGSASAELTKAAELRTDLRTVLLSGDETADRKALKDALAGAAVPIRIVPAAATTDGLLRWLRTRLGKATVPVFAPAAGQRVVVASHDLAVQWPDGRPGDWDLVQGTERAGYATLDSGHLARSVTVGQPVTAAELVAWELRESRLPVHLTPQRADLVDTWGNEIEYDTAENADPETVNAGVVADLRKHGLSRQDGLAAYHAAMQAGYNSRRDGWTVENDSSVTGEAVTPILPHGPATRRASTWGESWHDIALAKAVIRRSGGVYNHRTGSHIHISLASFQQRPQRLINLIRHLVHRQDVLYRIGADELHHRGTAYATPLPATGFEHLSWAGLARFGGDRSALALHPLLTSIGNPAADHVEWRVPDGQAELGRLQLLVRIIQRLVRLSVDGGPADYRPQLLGEHFGDRSPETERAGLELLLELFAADEEPIREQLRAAWARSRWQPETPMGAPRVGQEIGTVLATSAYFAVPAAQHQENIQSLRRLTAGMVQPVVVFHQLDPSAPMSLEHPRRNFATLAARLGRYGQATPRSLVVLFEPAGMASPAHERTLADLADEHQALIVRPAPADTEELVTTGAEGLSAPGGWEAREPGGRVRALGPVLRRDQLDELATHVPAAEQPSGQPAKGTVRWVGQAPATIGPLSGLADVAARSGRPVVVLQPDRTGPRGVPQLSVARLAALRDMLAADPEVARTGVLLVLGDAGAVDRLRVEHRMAAVFERDADPDRSVRPGWRLVTPDARVLGLGADLDRAAMERAVAHLDLVPYVRADEHLRAAVRRTPAGDDCLAFVQGFAAEAFPTGIRPGARSGAAAVDDDGVGQFLPHVPDRDVARVDSWDAVRAQLVQPGDVALVLAGRPGNIGHAVAAWFDGTRYVYADFTENSGVRVVTDPETLIPGIDLRMVMVAESGTTRPVPVPATPESRSDPRALVDASLPDRTGTKYGKGGTETEDPGTLFDPDAPQQIYGTKALIGTGDGFTIVVDHHYRLIDGKRVKFNRAEFVTVAGAILPGEAGPTLAELRARTNAVVRRLRTVPEDVEIPLRQLLSEAGVTLSPLGQRLYYRGASPSRHLLHHWTWGVPPHFLTNLQAWVAAHGIPTHISTKLLKVAFPTGRQARDEFVRSTKGRALPADRHVLTGVITMAHPYFAAPFEDMLAAATGRGQMLKTYLVMASRVDFVGIRNAMSDDLREFLSGNGELIRQIFKTRITRASVPRLLILATKNGRFDHATRTLDVFFEHAGADDPYANSMRDLQSGLLNNLLYGLAMPDGTPISRVPMSRFGIGTDFAEIDRDPEPLFIVELRAIAAALSALAEADRVTDELTAMVRGASGPYRMSAAEADELTTANAAAIKESATRLAEFGVAAAARNEAVTADDLRWATKGQAAIEAVFGPADPRTLRALSHVDDARRNHSLASDLRSRAEAYAAADERLRAAVRSAPAGVDCLDFVQGVMAKAFPTGVRQGGSSAVDDIGVGRVLPHIPDRAFGRVDSWDVVREQIVEPGTVALVLAGRPGNVGHAIVAWHDGTNPVYADFTKNSGVRVFTDPEQLIAGIDLRLAVVAESGVTRPAPTTLESDSLPRALVDASSADEHGRRYGKFGVETEIPIEVLDPEDPDVELDYGAVVVEAPGYQLKIDHKTATDGSKINVLEFVTKKLALYPGESGVDPDLALPYLQPIVASMADLDDGEEEPVDEVLSAQVTGVQPSRLAEQLVVRGGTLGRFYHQWTFGIPMHHVSERLRLTLGRQADSRSAEQRKALLRDGLAFGEQVAADFVRATGGRALEEDRRVLEGVMTVGYTHLAAELYSGGRGLTKRVIAAATRVHFAGLNAALSKEARDYLRDSGQRLRTLIGERVDRVEFFEAARRFQVLDSDTGRVDLFRSRGLSELVDNLLYGTRRPDGTEIPVADLTDTMGIHTYQDAVDEAWIDGVLVKLLALEFRYEADAYADIPRSIAATRELVADVRKVGPHRMTDREAAGLNTRNLEAIDRTTELTRRIDADLRAGRTPAEEAVRWAADNAATAAEDLRFAAATNRAVRQRFGDDHPRTADARSNLETAHRIEEIARGLTAHAAASSLQRDPLVAAPPGAQWHGRLLALGQWTGQGLAQLVQLRDWADGMRRPVIAVYAPANAEPTMAALASVLLSFAQLGVHPVVLVGAAPAGDLEDLRARFQPVTIQHTTAGMDDVWQLRAPGGAQVRLDERLTQGLFEAADRLPGVVTGHELSPVVVNWLALTDWPAREEFLRTHVVDLMAPAVTAQLVSAREGAPYAVLLDLVRRNGGLSGPATPRYVPTSTSLLDSEPPFDFHGPLPETFVIDYVARKRTPEERKPWNDQLLWLLQREQLGLSPGEARLLAQSIQDEAARPNATVFGAVEKVLAMTPPEAAAEFRVLGEELRAYGRYRGVGTKLADILNAITRCELEPHDKAAWVFRLEAFSRWLRDTGRDAYADLIDLVPANLASCYDQPVEAGGYR